VSERIDADARAFARVPDMYERGRPEYPAAAIELLAERLELQPGRRILDLAAGTGKLTRRLLETGADVVAVEPTAEFRALLPAAAEVHDGVAAALPLPDASVDAATVAQAFHWFRPEEALPELHRVLRSGGRLALLWNTRDEGDPLQVAVTELLDGFGRERWRDTLDVPATLAGSGLFGDVEEVRLPNRQELDVAGFLDRYLSISFVAASPRERQDELAAQLRDLVAGREQPILVPYVTEIYLARRLDVS
jgi:SAM-dependent methyltransferase